MDIVFDIKKRLTDSDGNEYIDMSDSVFSDENINISSGFLLNKSYEARIDKVVHDTMGNLPAAVDTFMYANNIINPFTLAENDVVFVASHSDNYYSESHAPTFPQHSKESEYADKDDENKSAAQTFNDKLEAANEQLKSKPDEHRKERLKRLAEANKQPAKPLAPNMLQPGEVSKIYSDSSIVLGTTMNIKQ